jgi:hypothetical protein
VSRLRAGRARGGRGERGPFLIISFSWGAGVYRFFGRCGRVFCPHLLFRRRFPGRLTSSLSLRYNSGMVRRVNSAPRAGIQLARKKQIFIFYTIVGGKILSKKSST